MVLTCLCCLNIFVRFNCSEPSGALSFFPLALLCLTRSCGVDAHTVLLAVGPFAFILTAVRPMEGAVARLFVVDVVSIVFAAVWPLKNAVTLHLVVLPEAFVLASVRPVVHT